jgi:membrane protease YdiL (CAAX protease family)
MENNQTQNSGAGMGISFKSANGLYAVVVLLLATVGSISQSISASWGVVFTELIIILLPALGLLWVRKLPVKKTIRLNRIESNTILPIMLTGIGVSFFLQWLAALISGLTGINPGVTPDLLPTNFGEALLIFACLCILAPICEEIFFRGVILRGYEGFGVSGACIGVGLLFAGFHLSLLRLIVLLPIAVILCWVVLRSNSIYSSMILHFFYNLPSAFLLIFSSLYPAMSLGWANSLLLAPLGLLIGVCGLIWFNRVTVMQAADAVGVPVVQRGEIRFSAILPLIVAFLMIGAVSASEVILAKAPRLLAMGQNLTFTPLSQTSRRQMTYEIQDILNEKVGTMECLSEPVGDNLHLTCNIRQDAFNVTQGSSQYRSDGYTETFSIEWRAKDMHLLHYEDVRTGNSWSISTRTEMDQNQMTVTTVDESGNTHHQTVPDGALLQPEWMWRMSGQPLYAGLIRLAEVIDPSIWSETTQGSRPQGNTSVIDVLTAERMMVGDDPLTTWKVDLNGKTAWYEVNGDHLLVKVDAGYAFYVLKESKNLDE